MANDPAKVQTATPVVERQLAGESDVYRYEPSGIKERSGYIPLWLKLMALSLILWGIYYAMRYWNSWSSA